jgi:hypothetical protein
MRRHLALLARWSRVAKPVSTREGESGQALPLAAVGIFVMVLGVLATLNLGQAVHQKIKLQNTADSAAYTLAAMEARTFNYIAFLNRAQIAHYNTAMVVQSYITWVGFQVATFGTAVDLLTTLKNAVDVGANWGCPYLGCPYIPLKAIVTGMATMAQLLQKLSVQLFGYGEKVGHWIVDAMSIFNDSAVWQTQLARAAVLNVHLLTGMQNYIEKHDKDISFKNGKSALLNLFVNMALNSIEYYQAFSNASGVNPYVYGLIRDFKRVAPSGEYKTVSDDGSKDAYRIMSELCHATRTPRFVSNRQESSFFSTAILANVYGRKYGQTKFTEKREMKNAEIPPIGSEGNYQVASSLSSDDYATSATGFATIGLGNVMYTGGKTLGDAIIAYRDESKHYKYKGGKTSGKISPNGKGVFAFPPVSGTNSTMETEDDKSHAPWKGFAPYFLFNAKGDRSADYNQPSTWIFLNKSHKDFQTASGSHAQSTRAPWYSNFSFENGGVVVKLDTTIGGSRNSYLFEGLNVISRGMAYYHRPDNWTEHPNFFNPFWRAKLAPVGQKLQNFWDRWVTSKITTSSDSAVVKALVNVLRNAQMDLFTAVITAAITH